MATSEIKALNLYAGIGGNRKRWNDVDVTAVEWDERRARCYHDHFPDDNVIVADAHEFLLDHHAEFDFIWTSPPCPTHSQLRQLVNPNVDPVYPDMKLYQEILLLQHNFEGNWVVENVDPYYEPLIDAPLRGRHRVWSNFYVPEVEYEPSNIKRQDGSWDILAEKYGFDVTGYGWSKTEKRNVLNNCVDPRLGEHVFAAATTNRQVTLV